MSIQQENKRDRFAIKNDGELSKYHDTEIAVGVFKDDLSDHYNEWIGTQSLEDLKKILDK